MKITIVGGGFGGVKAALELAKHASNHITLISERSFFQYYPALYSTATGKSYRQAWAPLTEVIGRASNIHLIEDRIETIDPTAHTLMGESGKAYMYHTLILVLGSETTYFGIKGIQEYAYGIKSDEEIRRLQQHLKLELSDGRDDEKRYMIIGGGPTGVELAGGLGEYIRVLRKHYGITKKRLNISLVEAAPRILPRLSEASSKAAHRRLEKLGVHVETGMAVEKQTAHELIVNGHALTTHTVIWTSGVTNAGFYTANAEHFTFDKRGKIVVDEYLRAGKDIYVIGDNASTPYAGLAQTALHDGIFVARHIMGSHAPYKAQNPPIVIPIGHNWALFEWNKLRFSGRMGVVMRHAADMIGYNDVLPLSWAIGAWRARTHKQMFIPDDIETALKDNR